MIKRTVPIVLTIFSLSCSFAQLHAAPQDQDVFTDFETINTNLGDPFSIGVSPESATFSGDGFSGVAGIGELYFSGSHAWMVNPGGTGVIDFETNAATVEFWTRIRTGADGSSVYTAYDDTDQVIDTLTISSPAAFQLVSFTGSIDRIEVVNNATTAGDRLMNSIDNFGYTAVPEPSTIVLGIGMMLATLGVRRRSL